MMGAGVSQPSFLKRIESLLTLALSRANFAFSTVVLVADVLGNRQDGGISSGAGQSSTLSLAPITRTTGAPGAFEVSGYATITTSAAGDPVQATLRRDGAPIGTGLNLRTNTDAAFPLCIGPVVDPAGAGAHTYDVEVTNGTAGHTVQFTTGYALAQEVL